MAKDILVDTNKGDFLLPEWDKKIQYWEVIWGKLFDTDQEFYMNIIVPDNQRSTVRYDKNNRFVCYVHADYCAEALHFVVRFVVRKDTDGSLLDFYSINQSVPFPSKGMYRQDFMSTPQLIYASQLQMIENGGYFQVEFQNYNGGNITRAVFYQAEAVDFQIGEGENQSAQLLARCAPGKYYRFPTTGVDLTKYIGSVVEHTDLSKVLQDEFEYDQKNITEADFNNSNGDLQILFNGANDAEDKNLDDPSTLDIELFRVADDDYVRALYRAAQGILMDNEGYRNDILGWSGNLVGIWDVGSECKLSKCTYVYPSTGKRIQPSGLVDDENGYKVGNYRMETGKLYALNYDTDTLPIGMDRVTVNLNGEVQHLGVWKQDGLYVAEADGEVFVDEPFKTYDFGTYMEYKKALNRRLLIPLKACDFHCYIGSGNDEDLSSKGYGLTTVTDESGNYVSILAIAKHPTTGKLYGIVSLDSHIEEVRIEINTGRLLVIKQK